MGSWMKRDGTRATSGPEKWVGAWSSCGTPTAPYGSLALRPELKPRGGGKLIQFLMQRQHDSSIDSGSRHYVGASKWTRSSHPILPDSTTKRGGQTRPRGRSVAERMRNNIDLRSETGHACVDVWLDCELMPGVIWFLIAAGFLCAPHRCNTCFATSSTTGCLPKPVAQRE